MSDTPFMSFDAPIPLEGSPVACGIIVYSSSYVDQHEKRQPAVSIQFQLADGTHLPPVTVAVGRAELGRVAGYLLAAIDHALTTVPL